jgi:AcrR family transcriptional regulator
MSTSARDYGDPATRRQILTAAWSLIEDGDTDARLSDVGARAGVSRRAIYLHFGDRAGLLAALVEFMDEAIGVRELAEPVWSATSPEEMPAALVAFYAHLNPRVDAVARLLEARPRDAAARAAWRSRMETRREIHREVIRKIRDDGALASEWTVDAAADVLHAMMLPSAWRELTEEVGWKADACRTHLTAAVRRAFLELPS